MQDKNQVDRKGFLGVATWAIGGLISMGLAVPGVSYLIGPSLQRQNEDEWIQLGSASKIEIGIPTLLKTTIRRQTGWIISEEQVSAYIYTEEGRDYIAFSNICSHLGCKVRWIDGEDQFFCPCHNAVFDRDGEVLTGPPPRALDRYQVKIEDDQIFIQGV